MDAPNEIPVNRVQTYRDLCIVLMKIIFLSALYFLINTRYKFVSVIVGGPWWRAKILSSRPLCGTIIANYGGKPCNLIKLVNFVGAQVLEFIADFGKPSTPLPIEIVACVPKKVHIEGAGVIEFKISSTEITDVIKAGLDNPIEPEPEDSNSF
ncbi:stromal processing peptidase, chloroplastic-like isoform X2 [Vicia villosa]|uniref:stromal processing peptidase, chloroplastic-like isoform X2 n=1 Tax=Vicia villosa TaxID=3911 RepID=UPI00273BF438|nr:stromal processing peptidase, chloroplastic-like isoform X2 [Vicia villosa]